MNQLTAEEEMMDWVKFYFEFMYLKPYAFDLSQK